MSEQRGSISVVLAAAILVVLVMALGIADLGKVLVARSRARSAADAAALAAAQELAVPSGLDPSIVAAGYASMHDASLISCICEVGTWEAVVEVELPAGSLLLIPTAPVVRARARAVVDVPGST